MSAPSALADRRAGPRGPEHLIRVIQDLSMARDVPRVVEIVRHAARDVAAADGAAFVLRDGDLCHYVDEDAIGPLWKGKRFPMSACVSGWAMLNRKTAVIEDIYTDPRVPADAYRPTFVKSLAMVPIRTAEPLGAIGVYWAAPHAARPEELSLLQSLADSTSIALEGIALREGLEETVRERTRHLEELTHELEAVSQAVAQDLRAPLRALRGHAEELARVHAGALDAKGRELLARVSASGAHLDRLIVDLLEYGRIGRGELAPELVRLDAVVAEVLARLAPEVAASGARVETRVGDARVLGPRVLLARVVTHLVSNALKSSAWAARPAASRCTATAAASGSASRASSERGQTRKLARSWAVTLSPRTWRAARAAAADSDCSSSPSTPRTWKVWRHVA